jgi:hypothetical protein
MHRANSKQGALTPGKVLMKKVMFVCGALACGLAGNVFASDNSCTIAQVMKTVHQKRAYAKYEYASDYEGKQGAPTLKQNENSDQYLFWVDKDGQTCPAVVTYESGKCTDGKAVVKTDNCQ